MGTGTAHAFATAWFAPERADLKAEARTKARASISRILEDGVRLGKLTAEQQQNALNNLTEARSVAAAADGAGLLVETVSENLSVKQAVVREAAEVMDPGAVIATNTSALSVTEIAAGIVDSSRVIGMHFFNPVHKMKLIELVRGLQTSDETLVRTLAYGDVLG